jgi:hypothetical protein
MSVDPRTLGWLSRALTHEMSAVQQYLAQSVLARLVGRRGIGGKHLRHEAIRRTGARRALRDPEGAALLRGILEEELAHVQKIDGMLNTPGGA